MDNLDRSPLYTKVIEGVGPRYCPSIEDKIMRFKDKPSHQIFIEPEVIEPEAKSSLVIPLPDDVHQRVLP